MGADVDEIEILPVQEVAGVELEEEEEDDGQEQEDDEEEEEEEEVIRCDDGIDEVLRPDNGVRTK